MSSLDWNTIAILWAVVTAVIAMAAGCGLNGIATQLKRIADALEKK